MHIVEQKHNSINFKKIQLQKVEQEKAIKLLESLHTAKSSEISQKIKYELFNIFDKHLQNEANKFLNNIFINRDDFLQTLYLKFFEYIDKAKEKIIVMPDLLEMLNKTAPKKDDKKLPTTSLEVIGGSRFITEKHLPVYAATRNEEEAEIIRTQYNMVVKGVSLSNRKKEVLGYKSEGLSSLEISKKLGLSEPTIRYLYHSAIAEIQSNNGILPAKIKNISNALQKHFEIEDTQLVEKKIINTPALFAYEAKDLVENAIDTCKALGLNKKEFSDMFLKCPDLLRRKPKYITTQFNKALELFNFETQEYLEILKKCPVLLLQKPETLLENIQKNSEQFNIKFEDFLKCAKKHPQLFDQSPTKLYSNIQKSSELLKIEMSKFIKCALKQPSLFYQTPETIHDRVNSIIKKLGVNERDYIKAGLKVPTLFYISKDTIISNVKTSSEKLEIEPKTFISMAMKEPALFYLKPETLYSNAQRVSEFLNIELPQYMRCIKSNPQLLYQSPDTLHSNLKYCSELLDVDFNALIKTVLSYPKLLYAKPETIYSNICESAKLIGVPTNILTERALKTPIMFSLTPTTFYKSFAIDKFYKKIKGVEDTFTLDTSTIDKKCERILAYLLKKNFKGITNVSQTNLWDILERYPEKELIFEILDDEMFDLFQKYITEAFQKHSVKNKFEIIKIV